MRLGTDDAGQKKLAAIMVGTVLIAVMVLLIAQRWVAERAELSANIMVQAGIIGANASAALVFEDEAAASEMLTALDASSAVLQAALYRADGSRFVRFVARKHPPQGEAELDAIAPAQGVEYSWTRLRVTKSIRLHNKEIGRIAILATQGGVYEELREFLAVFAVVALLATIIAHLATARMRRRIALSRTQLEQSRAMLHQLISHRERIIEEEHKRIAMEIHDQLGQNLTAALLNLRLVERGATGLRQEEIGQIREVENQLNEAYRGMKDIAAVLHPAVLRFGLVPALEWLAERILTPAGIDWHLRPMERMPVLRQQELLPLFRIVQESLTNIVRHAAAKKVSIVLRQSDDEFLLEIVDDGQGFDPAAVDGATHFGLTGIHERAQALAARVDIDSAVGQGTCVRIAVPFVGLGVPPVGWHNTRP